MARTRSLCTPRGSPAPSTRILKRFRFIEVVGEPKRVRSSFVKGYEDLPVRIHP